MVPEPIVFISHFEVKPGHVEAFRAMWRSVIDQLEASKPATVAQIAAVSHGGDRMPPKTTFFWPKPRTGIVFRPLR